MQLRTALAQTRVNRREYYLPRYAPRASRRQPHEKFYRRDLFDHHTAPNTQQVVNTAVRISFVKQVKIGRRIQGRAGYVAPTEYLSQLELFYPENNNGNLFIVITTASDVFEFYYSLNYLADEFNVRMKGLKG